MTTTDFPMWRRKYAGAIASNRMAFPSFPEPVIPLDFPLFKPRISKYSKVVALDKFQIYPVKAHSQYLDTVRFLIRSQGLPNDRWAYKLHPACETDNKLNQLVTNIFSENIHPSATFEQLKQHECIEDIGLHGNTITFGYMSSCLFYINHYGGNVMSFKHALEDHAPIYREIWHKYFPAQLETLLCGFPQLPKLSQSQQEI